MVHISLIEIDEYFSTKYFDTNISNFAIAMDNGVIRRVICQVVNENNLVDGTKMFWWLINREIVDIK